LSLSGGSSLTVGGALINFIGTGNTLSISKTCAQRLHDDREPAVFRARRGGGQPGDQARQPHPEPDRQHPEHREGLGRDRGDRRAQVKQGP